MKRITVIILSIFCFSAFFALNASAKTELTYANFFPPTHMQSQLAESWCKEVEKRTNGEISIKYFPAGSLAKGNQIYDSVVTGIADIGMTVLAYTRGRFPISEGIDLPLGYASGVQATNVANALYNKFQPKEFDDTKIMFLHGHGPGLIHTIDKKVSTIEDLKGLKIRAHGTSGVIAGALGASPVGKGMGECYQMLQKGVVDGSMHPAEANKGWKLGEVVKYMTANHAIGYTTTFAVMMNKNKWNELTPKNQKIIDEINAEWIIKHGIAWDEVDKAGIDFFKSKGGEIISLSDTEAEKWKEAVAPIIDGYIKKANESG
ncbi:MAG: TRAP transporter substrate-binding protein, partial [Proteobacteria bacterium]|nr:TRAP transporter substrate-binding protein [Pseudomonadota bacterium]